VINEHVDRELHSDALEKKVTDSLYRDGLRPGGISRKRAKWMIT